MVFCTRPEAASDVMSCMFVRPIVLDKCVKFRNPRSNRRRHFRQYFRDNFRLGVDNDVISGVAVAHFGADVRIKFGDSRSHGSTDIFEELIVSNERTNMTEAYKSNIRQKRLIGVSPKNRRGAARFYAHHFSESQLRRRLSPVRRCHNLSVLCCLLEMDGRH